MRDVTPARYQLLTAKTSVRAWGLGALVVSTWPSIAQAQALTVVSLLPARNAVAAPRTTPVTITFNQPHGQRLA